ncbi:hypothetical protein [Mycobacterium sp. PSTR-4-N]|uniref:hypothetical protein n=1 Tax=Mycobacterium sp. PSTR-4-N TaxID=2917745 RepID=UPI001F151B32|nr:hypothetical protein [Mycobacterium sp. PSTR-4-N]MCG7594103.1 hypothetical protein [Mycobacterium sp. PSTR-4-N]
MLMRTEKSALVVCRSEIDRLYYRGYRISDGASIDLHEVFRRGNDYIAVNAADNARYVITPNGFQLIQNDTVVLDEPAVETGPGPVSQMPAPEATSTVALGSAADIGPASLGYGSEHPTVISMGSCANTVTDIVWQNWGGTQAHGSGLGCVQVGQPPQYQLIASDIAVCRGKLAYRTLQISTNPPQIICGG